MTTLAPSAFLAAMDELLGDDLRDESAADALRAERGGRVRCGALSGTSQDRCTLARGHTGAHWCEDPAFSWEGG